MAVAIAAISAAAQSFYYSDTEQTDPAEVDPGSVKQLPLDRVSFSQLHVALARGDRASFHAILAPTVPLSRHIFGAPTRFYKTGVVFMAWLNGHQDHFVMVGGQQSARSVLHFAELFRLADAAGLLQDPEFACRRMKQFLTVNGVA